MACKIRENNSLFLGLKLNFRDKNIYLIFILAILVWQFRKGFFKCWIGMHRGKRLSKYRLGLNRLLISIVRILVCFWRKKIIKVRRKLSIFFRKIIVEISIRVLEI